MDFYKGNGRAPGSNIEIAPRFLSDDSFAAQTSPGRYRLISDVDGADNSAGLRVVRAINTSLALRMPLLVSGEPGSGKTQLGYALAHELGKPTPFKFNTKSTSAAQDLFYTYDAVRHFQSSQSGSTSEVRDFIDYAPLGLAILLALPLSERRKFFPKAIFDGKVDAILTKARQKTLGLLRSEEPQQCVVIIDEVDKAPRDFPNDLLHEIENMNFRVPELRGLETSAIDPTLRPIVIITTNSERQLPDAFLRRCAYVHIDYPRGAALESILASRLEGLFAAGAPFVKDVQAFYENMRKRGQINKPPGTAELLQFLQAAAEQKVDPNLPLGEQLEAVEAGLSLLGKVKEDQDRLRMALKEWAETPR